MKEREREKEIENYKERCNSDLWNFLCFLYLSLILLLYVTSFALVLYQIELRPVAIDNRGLK